MSALLGSGNQDVSPLVALLCYRNQRVFPFSNGSFVAPPRLFNILSQVSHLWLEVPLHGGSVGGYLGQN